MSWSALVWLAAGLVLLIFGAELLVRGASRLALALGLTPLAIGLTVVAFGTSAPELAVSTLSALRGQADLSLGNVIGSNIFNVLFILGICAAIAPLAVHRNLVVVDVPIMLGASLLLALLGLDGGFGRLDGLLLLALLIGNTWFAMHLARREARAERAAVPREPARASVWPSLGLVLAGLLLLVLGSTWLSDAAVAIAKAFGVSELVIGLTIVAAGTSLPEVATSVLASLRGQRDIAVGNVVGSNIFNILGVLGTAAVVAPDGVAVAAPALRFDIPVLVAVAAACLPIFCTGHTIARWEGLLFLGYYAAYTVFLVLAARQSAALEAYERWMVVFVLPLTAVTLAVVAVRAWLGRRHA